MPLTGSALSQEAPVSEQRVADARPPAPAAVVPAVAPPVSDASTAPAAPAPADLAGQDARPAEQRVAEPSASAPPISAPVVTSPAGEAPAVVVAPPPAPAPTPPNPRAAQQQVAELRPMEPPRRAEPVAGAPPGRETRTSEPAVAAIDPRNQDSLAPAERPAAGVDPNTVVAALPPQAQVPVDRSDRIVRYVENFDGGDCFYVAPVAVGDSDATLEGYGNSTQPFDKLDAAFKRANGFEASIGVRMVTPAQCAAVAFLSRFRPTGPQAPQLRIDNVTMRPGDILTGTISAPKNLNVELLLVSDTGVVQNFSHLLTAGADTKSFAIDLWRTPGLPGGRPHLLIAVASTAPLDLLRVDHPISAEKFFAAVAGEAERNGRPLAAMARYFKLER